MNDRCVCHSFVVLVPFCGKKGFMEPRKLTITALRVLSAWSKGSTPKPGDVKALGAYALSDETELPADELACRIVARTCQAMIRQVSRAIEQREKKV
jgi:hypothetical protein